VLAGKEGGGKPQMRSWLTRFKALRRYPAFAAGIVIITIFVLVSIYTVIAIPYDQAVDLWRGGPGVWDETPRNAAPVWYDWFSSDRLPRTIVVSSQDGGTKIEEATGSGMKQVEITLPFEYSYDGFPKELRLFSETDYSGAPTAIKASWVTPDGRTIMVTESHPISKPTYYISQDRDLRSRLSELIPHIGLFADPADNEQSLQGSYRMVVIAEIPQENELDTELVVYGQVHGLAGTDHLSRDILVALLWGAPVGLLFGVLAAVGTTLITFALAAAGTWYGGKLDRFFQWLTQVNLIIPVLPVLIMWGHFYSRSIWYMLGWVIALSIFGGTMLTYRAMFLQAKEAPYIEAARAYGASNSRIIFRYLMPRIAPTLLPEFVLVIPTFVFLEATLAVLGLGDPDVPTWGKVMNDAVSQSGLYKGYYYWLVEPALLLMVLGIGFSLIGYSLDRIFNPRLRTV
jgi:peptide/nickel transport system permease protein